VRYNIEMSKDLEGGAPAVVGGEEGAEEEPMSAAGKCVLTMFLCLFGIMLVWIMYMPFGLYYDNPELPIWKKNDYRICVADGDVRTAALVRFDAGEGVPGDECSLRLHPGNTLLTDWEIMEYWAWATYNAHRQGESEVADNTHHIREFRQYDDMIELLRMSGAHRARAACDSLPGTERLRCLREKDAPPTLDWSWAREE